MEIKPEVKEALERIKESKDILFVRIKGVWVFSGRIKENYNIPDLWDKEKPWGLPAWENSGYGYYTPARLHKLAVERDPEHTVSHLVTLFTLFEQLVKHVHRSLYGTEIEADKFRFLIAFMKANGIFLSKEEEQAFVVAKFARNSFVHSAFDIDDDKYEIFKAYRKSLNSKHLAERDLGKIFGLDVVLPWHNMIIKFSERLLDLLEKTKGKMKMNYTENYGRQLINEIAKQIKLLK